MDTACPNWSTTSPGNTLHALPIKSVQHSYMILHHKRACMHLCHCKLDHQLAMIETIAMGLCACSLESLRGNLKTVMNSQPWLSMVDPT